MLSGKDLADFLKRSRQAAGLSQKEVAAALGYKSSQFVSNWERGLSSPPIATLRKLCSVYKTTEEQTFAIIREIAVKNLEKELKQEFFGSTS
jgi:transcriptional regulator with XRE-family HTH domain